MIEVTAHDIDILARTVYGESRGESDRGQLAAAFVVVNRAAKYRVGIGEACLLSTHFSCWNNARDNDRNQLAMMTADLSDPIYAQCMIAAVKAAHGFTGDPTMGATHYHADTIEPPSWARNHGYVSIGHHRFYRGID